jgi:nucleoside-diphosphate-sugar epimerase
VAAALRQAPLRRWAFNVADPQDLTYGGLTTFVAARLDREWVPKAVDWASDDHPWNVRHPVITDTSRPQDVLGVTAPYSLEATGAQIDWLWEHRDLVAAMTPRA